MTIPSDTRFESSVEPTLTSAGWRYRTIVASTVAVGVFLAVGLYAARGTSYVATAVLLIDQPATTPEGLAIRPERYLADQLEVIGSRVVAERAISMLQFDGDVDLLLEFTEGLEILGQVDSDAISISYSASDPEVARSRANAVADAYRQIRRDAIDATTDAAIAQTDSALAAIDIQLQEVEKDLAIRSSAAAPNELEGQLPLIIAELVELQSSLTLAVDVDAVAEIRASIADRRQQLEMLTILRDLSANAAGLEALLRTQANLIDQRSALVTQKNLLLIDAELQSDGIAFISPAPAGEPRNPASLVRYTAVGIALGLIVGLGIAYILAVRRRAFENRAHPEAVIKAPLLADIPVFEETDVQIPGIPVFTAPRSAAAESYRFAAASLEISTRGSGIKTIAVISALNGAGKTTAAANLALAAAREHRRVLVMDADFGDQSLSRVLMQDAFELRRGLTDVVAENGNPLDYAQDIHVNSGAGLGLLGRGLRPTIATEFFGLPEIQRLFERLKENYDVVFIDTPPLLQIAYSSSVLALADGAIAVVPHESSVGDAESLAARASFVGVPILGYIYNKAPLRREMTVTDGSMKDVVGDMGFSVAPLPRTRKPN